jgi:hypothetical protein
MPSRLRKSISDINLLEEGLGKPRRFMVVSARAHDRDTALCERFTLDGGNAVHRVVPDPVLNDGGAPGFILVAHNIPIAITAFLARKSN